jgi:hypothetical protein
MRTGLDWCGLGWTGLRANVAALAAASGAFAGLNMFIW